MMIDVDVLMEKLQDAAAHKGLGAAIAGILIQFIETLPIIDATPVVHAHWEKIGKHDWRCSACKIGVPYSFTGFHYCHNCGAKMDER